ncbi:MAG: P-loop NTPase [Sandaracinaceae bacterium]|nr:P-loop NTPase [Sandaracinaceae bacterium]
MKRAPIRISIGGGKGGVGKSLVATNLAASLASLGLRTVLVDGDLGAPNLHTLLGVAQSGPTLQALLERRVARIEETLVATQVPRLSLVAGASGGVPGQANPTHLEKLKLLRQIGSLDAEVVVIDVGAGTSFNALDLFSAGEIRLIVATPELTSLQNAYVFVKAVALREIAALAKADGKLEAWARAFDRGETSRMSAWLTKLDGLEPALAARVRRYLRLPGTALVGNRIGAPSERHALYALSRLGREFLDLELPLVSTIPSSQSIVDSVQRRRPAVFGQDADPSIARLFAKLAEHVVTCERRPRELPALDEPPADESAIEPMAGFASQLGARQRKEARVTVSLAARVRMASGEHDAVLVDLSPGGARVSCQGSVRVGERVEVAVPHDGLEVVLAGRVRHASRETFGLELEPGCAARVQRLLSPEVSQLASPA